MSRYDDGDWPAYVPVAERRRQAEREAAKLRKKGQTLAPVRIEGRAIATTPWGRAWCSNLESYRDYESRLARGRTYVRNGSVIDLQIGRCEVKALVSGSAIYRVGIGITAMPAAQWRSLCADCAGRIESLVELLQGRLSKSVMERMCRQGVGLFPKPSEIRFSCSCEDHASMCKHVAAALYGVGARLDGSPELLFRLRGVDPDDLMAGIASATPASEPAGERVLASSDLSALFGLDLAEAGGAAAHRPGDRASAPRKTRRAPPIVAPASPAKPAAAKKRAAAQPSQPKASGRQEAEKMVADVVARIGQQLVAGVDVTPAQPAPKARGVRTLRDPAGGSAAQPGRKQAARKPVKQAKDAR